MVGGLEPPVSARKSSKEACSQGKTIVAWRLSIPFAPTILLSPKLHTHTPGEGEDLKSRK